LFLPWLASLAASLGGIMEIFRRRNSQIYTARFYIDGYRYVRSTGETDRKEAIKKANALYMKVLHDGCAISRRRCAVSLGDIATMDIEAQALLVADGKSLQTRLKQLWKTIIKTAGDINPDIWCEQRAVRYIKKRKKTARNQTIKKELQALRRGLNLAMRRGVIKKQEHWWPKLKSEKPSSAAGQYHDIETIQAVCEHLPDDARDELLFVLLTGVRKTELKRLKFCHITDNTLILSSELTKNGTLRRVPLSKNALLIVKKRRLGTMSDYIFSRQNHVGAMRTASRKAGLMRPITLRDARHIFHTIGLQQTADQTAVMRLAGNGLHVIERYQHTTKERDQQVVDLIAQYSNNLFS
jgi:integrase